MSLDQASGISPLRMDRIAGPLVPAAASPQRQAAPAPAPAPAAARRSDQLVLNPESIALNRLVRMWGALSSLFGVGQNQSAGGGAPAWSPPDFSALADAITQARQNAEDMQVRQQVSDTLKTSVLRGAEALVQKYYGLSGDGVNVKVSYDNSIDGALAQVTFAYDKQGRIVNPQLHLNISQFEPDTSSNGTNDHVIQNDRIVAHEMTHLIMGRNLDLAALPDWFAEGTAEYVAGGAERVGLSLQQQSPSRLLARLLQPWQGTSDDYSAGYLAVRFLDQATQEGGGIKELMQRLKAGDSLDTAIATVSGGRWKSTSDFLTSFVTDGSGLAFVRSIDLSGRDAGSIKPGPGPNVVPDGGTRSDQPLQGFRIQWPSPLEGLQLLATPTPFDFGFGGGRGFTSATAAALAYRRQMPGRRGTLPV